MKAEQIKPSTKAAEWNAMLAHRLRVQSDRNDRLKVRSVLMTVWAFGTGFLVGVML